ncbi:hypothetical protein SAMN04488121_1031068 [Chitinophaga filiformis]|uniref:DUF5977 domain-containing protein n=1 Tax=Chitinophaga filiformis TaxID=104663 RepID=A0A1G7SYA5_CHIFI|nr:hypothetical protein SAMN04488121_1031068 [Chitinophaga filiformis]
MSKFSVRSIFCVPFIICLLGTYIAKSQSKAGSLSNGFIPEVVPPSPTAASLGKFGAWPVSYYTGVANVSVSIYDVKEGKLSLPISLGYHGSGVRVEEVSAGTGVGWTLNAGGAITRTIIGLADNDPNGYLTRLKSGIVLQDNYALNNVNTFLYFNKVTDGEIDTEPDAYFYNFNGRSGKFFFDEKGNFHSIPENALKLTKNPFMSGSAANIWEIVDESGTIYTFGSTDGVSGGVEQTRIADGSPGSFEFFDNAWYLTSIISADKSDTISLQYVDKSESYTLKSTQSLKELTSPMTYQPALNSSWTTILHTSTVLYNGTPNSDPMNTRQLTTGKGGLSSIRWSQGEVRFKSNTARQDMLSGTLLDSIEVVATGTGSLVKKFLFQYSYTGNRYYLDSVSEYNKSRTDKMTHSFYYYSGLPSRFSNSQDHWGYFNGAGNSNLLPNNSKLQTILSANREPDEAAMKAGTLWRIKYPTGGYTDFDYEAHRYQASVTPGAPTTVVGSNTIWVSNYNPKMPRGFDSTATFVVTETQSDATIEIEFTDYFKPPMKDRAWLPYVKLERLSGSTYVQTNYWNAFDLFPGGNIPANPDGSYNVIVPKTTFNLPSGSYRITVDNTCSYFDCGEEWQKGHILAGITFRTQSTSTTPGAPPPPIAGGLRIKSIKNYDNIGTAPVEIKKFEYSPGILLTYPAYIHYYAVDMWGSSEQMYDLCKTNFANYIEETSSSQVILGVTQGASVGYQEVREYNVDNNSIDNGYTKYNYLFTADSSNSYYFDHTYWPGLDIAAANNSIPVNNYDYKRGLLSEKTVYVKKGSSYAPVSRVKDEYAFNDGDTTLLYRRLKALRVKKLRTVLYPCGNEQDGYFIPATDEYKNDYGYGIYNLVTSWVQKTSTEETMYNPDDGTSLTSLTRYYYDNKKHLGVTRTVTTDSKNQTFTTYTKYPDEMVSGGSTVPYSDMVSRNMIGNVVEQRIVKNDTAEISKERINYAAFTSALIAPSKLESSVLGNPLEEKASIQLYDASGNITQYRERNGLSSALIYDYNNSLVVAKAANAVLTDIAYSGFETSSTGNWQMGTARNTTTSLTGKASYTLSGGDIGKTGLDGTKTYMVSYWAKGASATVNGQSGTAGKTINGWTFYQHKLAAGATTITVKGTVIIDELRLLPQNAMMQTFVHDPLIGMTAQSDANNAISYFDYDGFNRLLQVRDAYGNILKRYEYSYVRPVSQPTTSIYFNVQKVATFKKNDCTIGDGSVLTYVVPAEKYKSYVSQADADAYADAEINANGQNYANTTGTCNFYNVAKSKVFTPTTCGLGYVGSPYNYVVPAGRYIVQTSQAAADSLAQREIDIYGQSYADSHGTCVPDPTANFFVGECPTAGVSTFSVTITNINGVVLYQYEFKGIGDPVLPYKEMLPASNSYVVKIQGMQPFNAIVNGVEQAVSGVKSWNVSTPIIIEVYK